ncbi:hypothetical protein G1C97_0448 [Bifidobacterium sp. DSM 109959]|uniref:Uncharacterized protein n=1 Tax=Bifidobacterium olomucense TaxID=2675324 RepID=A0A7Y0EW35_9BIFI|nr:hypothetical protein [Bifidobacterium sp. DSM 109959]
MLRGIILVLFAVLGFIIAGGLRRGKCWTWCLGSLAPAASRLVPVVLVVLGVVYLRIDAHRREARKAPRRVGVTCPDSGAWGPLLTHVGLLLLLVRGQKA